MRYRKLGLKINEQPGETAEWVRALTVVAEDRGLLSSNRVELLTMTREYNVLF